MRIALFAKNTERMGMCMVKRVAAINDLSGLGKCSLTAAIPVLSVMGVQACPLPTAILTNQTGYDSYYCDDYTDKMDRYTEEWQKRGLTFDGIFTGYLGNAAQVEKILRFCEIFRKEETLLLVDPAMADRGRVYALCTAELSRRMKDLVALADVVTPNLTECCLLTGNDYGELISHAGKPGYLDRVANMARALLSPQLRTVIVTGILHREPCDGATKYYNLVLTAEGCDWVTSERYGESYSGTGDLLSSVVCAGMVRGDGALCATRLGVRFLERALRETVQEPIPHNDGINFEPYLSMLLPG